MATIQVRNVPENVHRTLRARAAATGQSLQEYVLSELVEHARLRDVADVIAEARVDIASHAADFSDVSTVDVIRRDRDSH